VESCHGWLDEMAFERTQHTRVALSPHTVGSYSHLGSMLSHDTYVYGKAILGYSCVLLCGRISGVCGLQVDTNGPPCGENGSV
jgi:hypothetical protein